MAQHFAWSDSVSEVAPFNVQYGFPSQTIKAVKSTVKLTPREAGPFSPGQVIRIDLPAQGYLNALNSTLRFRVQVQSTGSVNLTARNCVRISKNANSVFNRLRIIYGSIVLEDVNDYNILCRMLTNATVAEDYSNYAGAIYEGLGNEINRSQNQSTGYFTTPTGDPTISIEQSAGVQFQINLLSGLLTQRKLLPLKWMASSIRIELYVAPAYQALIIGNPSVAIFTSPNTSSDITRPTLQTTGNPDISLFQGTTLDTTVYTNSFANLDGFAQNGVYPGITYTAGASSGPGGGTNDADVTGLVGPLDPLINNGAGQVKMTSAQLSATYRIRDVEFVAELLDFDDVYDAKFQELMMSSGVPIHFTSWHNFPFAIVGSNAQYPIQERAKSIKAALGCILSNNLNSNSPQAFFFDSFAMTRLGLSEYQWRVGGKYYPSQNVSTKGPASEAFVELQKALNMLGRYEAGCQIHPWLYGTPQHAYVDNEGSFYSTDNLETNNLAYTTPTIAYADPTPSVLTAVNKLSTANLYSFRGSMDHALGKHYPWLTFSTGTRPQELAGGACSSFMLGASFETSNGYGISGLNGEEQNEILLRMTHNSTAISSATSFAGNTLYVFTYYDAMIVIRPQNIVDLIF